MTDKNELDLTQRLPEPVIAWLDGDTSPETMAAVDSWLAESSEHRNMLDDFLAVWRASQVPDAQPALEDLHRRLDQLEFSERAPAASTVTSPARSTATTPAKRRAGGGWRTAWRAAAVLVVGLGIGLGWPHVRSAFTPAQYARVVVPAGSQTTLQLPDGIEVRLNYATELAYVPGEDVRDVYLEGEAFFKVPNGSDRTLRVHTEAGLVRDLGTEFNVHARDGRTAVTVTQGLVELETPLGIVALNEGEASSATVGEAPLPATVARLDAATDWLVGRLTFYDEPLASVAAELERRYGVPFEVDPALRSVRINARIDIDASARDALEATCISLEASCSWQGDRWRITGE